MKPFDLEKAKAGAKVCTRDGREARIIHFDMNGEYFHIVALIQNNKYEDSYKYTNNGYYLSTEDPSRADLMMVGEKREGWVNIINDVAGIGSRITASTIYPSKEEAENITYGTHDRIATIKIEWEE